MRTTIPLRAVTGVVVAAIVATALLPLVLLGVSSVARSWFWPDLLPPAWSLRAWRYVADGGGGIASALATSLAIALGVSIVSVVAALPAARALALHQFRGKRLLLFALLLPVLAPPLAATMGIHAVFVRAGLPDSSISVAWVHLVPALPYATLMLAGSFATFEVDYEAQARTLGASPLAVWRHVTLPAIASGIAVAAVFAFLISWSQYLLTLLIGGGRVLTLPLLLVGFQRGGDEAAGAALSLLFVAPTILLFGLVSRTLREMW